MLLANVTKQAHSQRSRKKARQKMYMVRESDLKVWATARTSVQVTIQSVQKAEAIWYQMVLEVEGTHGGALLLTALNEVKLWGRLDTAVRYVRDKLPQVEYVTIVLKVEKAQKGGAG